MAWNTNRWARSLIRPRTWSVKARRMFVVGLPVAIPLWLLAFLVVATIGTMKSILRPISSYWNDPPKRLGSGNYHYSSMGSDRSKVLRIEDARDKRDAA